MVEVGGARPFNPRDDRNVTNLDPSKPLYAIRGSYKGYQCAPVNDIDRNAGRNCNLYDSQHAEGFCFHDTFGDWHCNMIDPDSKLISQIAAPPGGIKPAVKPAGEKDAKNPTPKQGEPQEDKKDAVVGEGSKYAKPDFSAMDQYFEILKYKYDLNGAIAVTVKAKLDYADRTGNGWYIDFYDADDVSLCIQHRLLEGSYPVDAGKNEVLTAFGCGEEVMKRTKKVVITKIPG